MCLGKAVCLAGVRLFTEKVRYDVLCDAIHPGIERRVPAEGVDGAKCFQPGFLCQVFGKLGFFDTAVDVSIQPGVVFANEAMGRFGVAVLSACDKLFGAESNMPAWGFLPFHSLSSPVFQR